MEMFGVKFAEQQCSTEELRLILEDYVVILVQFSTVFVFSQRSIEINGHDMVLCTTFGFKIVSGWGVN